MDSLPFINKWYIDVLYATMSFSSDFFGGKFQTLKIFRVY